MLFLPPLIRTWIGGIMEKPLSPIFLMSLFSTAWYCSFICKSVVRLMWRLSDKNCCQEYSQILVSFVLAITALIASLFISAWHIDRNLMQRWYRYLKHKSVKEKLALPSTNKSISSY